MGWKEFEALAAQQQFVAHVSQARTCELSPGRVRAVAAARDWRRPFDGLIWLPGPETPQRWMMSGLLLAGEDSLITGRSALYLHGLVTTCPTKIELVVPYGRDIPCWDRLHVRRSRTLASEDMTDIDGLRATTVERTLCQMAHNTAMSVLRPLALEARRLGLITTASLRACVVRMGNFPGAKLMLRLVDEIDEDASESEFEFKMRRRLLGAGLRPDAEQQWVRTPRRRIRVDIPWADFKVGLECDSLGYHGSRASLDRDVDRYNGARGTEWVILRATWTHVDDDQALADLVADLRTALRAAGHPKP